MGGVAPRDADGPRRGGPQWDDYAARSNVAPAQAVCSAAGVATNPGINVTVYGRSCNGNGSATGNVPEVGATGGASAFGTSDQTSDAPEMVVRPESPGVLLLGGGTRDVANVSKTYAPGHQPGKRVRSSRRGSRRPRTRRTTRSGTPRRDTSRGGSPA